jgi:hypothetical protein
MKTDWQLPRLLMLLLGVMNFQRKELTAENVIFLVFK